MKAEQEDPIERAVRLHGDALAALGEGRIHDAAAAATDSLDLFERESGPYHPDVANVLNCLARIHEHRADYAAAEDCGRRSVDVMRRVREESPGADIDRLYVQSLTSLGDATRIRGKYAEAESCLREAISIAETALGTEDEDCVTALNSLAVVFKYSGRFDEAAGLYDRALRAAELAGAGDDTLATLLHNIGGLEHARGNYAAGEPAARRSVELRERALGPDHPSVAADVAALAAIIDGQGRYEEAEALYERALATFERVHGPDHYEIAVNVNNLAGVRQAQGRLADAEVLYRRSLAIKEALLGDDHPDVALTLNNLALLLDTTGNPEEAAALYERALRTFAHRLDRGHPKIQACARNYAALLRDQGRASEASVIESGYLIG
jgi:tetratricopeptide (TPR) repeat protein